MQTVIRVSDPRVSQKWDSDVKILFGTFPNSQQLVAADANRTVLGISYSAAADTGQQAVGPLRNGVIVPMVVFHSTDVQMVLFRLEDYGTVMQEAWFAPANASALNSFGVLTMRNTHPEDK